MSIEEVIKRVFTENIGQQVTKYKVYPSIECDIISIRARSLNTKFCSIRDEGILQLMQSVLPGCRAVVYEYETVRDYDPRDKEQGINRFTIVVNKCE